MTFTKKETKTLATRHLAGFDTGDCFIFPGENYVFMVLEINVLEAHAVRLVDGLQTSFALPRLVMPVTVEATWSIENN